MCGCGCDLVGAYAQAVAEQRAAEGAGDGRASLPQLDAGQGRYSGWRAWLLEKTRGALAALPMTRAPAHDRATAV
jgi:hypothetical protein